MIRSIWIVPFLHRFRRMMPLPVYTPFVFPEGCMPNISDPSTYETDILNISQFDFIVEDMVIYTNETKWEEIISWDDACPLKNMTKWEEMLKFGGLDY